MDFHAANIQLLSELFAFHLLLTIKSKVIYGDEKKDRSPEERFSYIIRCANEQSGCGVVVLVDEYDKPLLQALGNFIYRISGGCQQSASIDLSERLADYQGL